MIMINISYSTKDNERDLQVQDKVHIPNVYMKMEDKFPSTQGFKTLMCSHNNKKRLQNLVCNYLSNVCKSIDKEIIYSVASHCINLSTQQSMENYSFDQAVADTTIFSSYMCVTCAQHVIYIGQP